MSFRAVRSDSALMRRPPSVDAQGSLGSSAGTCPLSAGRAQQLVALRPVGPGGAGPSPVAGQFLAGLLGAGEGDGHAERLVPWDGPAPGAGGGDPLPGAAAGFPGAAGPRAAQRHGDGDGGTVAAARVVQRRPPLLRMAATGQSRPAPGTTLPVRAPGACFGRCAAVGGGRGRVLPHVPVPPSRQGRFQRGGPRARHVVVAVRRHRSPFNTSKSGGSWASHSGHSRATRVRARSRTSSGRSCADGTGRPCRAGPAGRRCRARSRAAPSAALSALAEAGAPRARHRPAPGRRPARRALPLPSPRRSPRGAEDRGGRHDDLPGGERARYPGNRQPGKFRETAHGQDAARQQRPARAMARPAHPLGQVFTVPGIPVGLPVP
jgi:hypothetical protein